MPHDDRLLAVRELAGRIMRHSLHAIGRSWPGWSPPRIEHGAREGLLVESEQFAAMPTRDLANMEGLEALAGAAATVGLDCEARSRTGRTSERAA